MLATWKKRALNVVAFHNSVEKLNFATARSLVTVKKVVIAKIAWLLLLQSI